MPSFMLNGPKVSRVTVNLPGGFAGIEQALGSVDSADLGEDARREVATSFQTLIRLVETRISPGADRLQYEIEILEPGMTQRTLIVLDEGEQDRAGMRTLADLVAALGLTAV